MSKTSDQDINSILQSLGLHDKEIQIYLELLKVGTSHATILGKRAGIVRSTAQYICHQLAKKGLFTALEKDRTIMYTAENPEKLLYLIDKEQQVINKKKRSVESIMGQLKALKSPHTLLPKVKFYEGKDQMIQLYDNILQMHSPIDSFEDKGEMEACIPEYFPDFIAYRVKNKIPNRVICPSTNPINKDTPKEFRQVRNVDVTKLPFSCDIKICQDQVSIFSFIENQPVGIAINHHDIAQNFQHLFNYLWNLLENHDQQDVKKK